MKATTPNRTRIAWIAGLVLVAGSALLLRQRDEALGMSSDGDGSKTSSGDSHPSDSATVDGKPPAARHRETGPPGSLTVDELVAIFERDGAAAALAAAKGIKGPA